MPIDQLSLFDLVEEIKGDDNKKQSEQIVPYVVGDKVKVDIKISAEDDAESYYYLLQLKNKKGIIQEVILEPHLQYRVLFGERTVYLYHDEIIWIG